ncbi:MAG: hypothetical protein IKJ61_07310 [Bacteroidaceae bacterium]|nr:hypothetical protein [Bacteroidaceae bacterium]
MDSKRLEMEKKVIAYYLPNPNTYAFGDIYSSKPYFRAVAQTNSGNPYVIRIECPNFPNSKPNAYVECMLRNHKGELMDSPNASDHTLEQHPNGWTQICHFHPNAWKPDMSIWMVYIRCVMWLNIYEQTLKTGNTMDYYLGHMSANYTLDDYLNA